MLARIRGLLTYANVMASLAVFIALGAGAYAAGLAPNSVKSKHIVDGQVKEVDLADAAVTAAKLGNDAVGSSNVGTDALQGSDINDSSLFNDNSLNDADINDAELYNDNSLTGADVNESTLFNDNSLNGADVDEDTLYNDNSLTGADVNESTLFNDNSLNGTDVNEASLGQVPSAVLGGLGRWAGDTDECRAFVSPVGAFKTCRSVTLDLPSSTRVLLIGTARNKFSAEGGGICRLTSAGGVVANTETQIGGTSPSPMTAITDPVGPGSTTFAISCAKTTVDDVYFNDLNLSAVALAPN